VGDAAKGKALYDARCSGCHSVDRNRVGPMHRGVVGRKAGSVPGYDYSPALRNAGFVWTPARLNTWLKNPGATVPGTKMPIRVSNAQDRSDIVAYLVSVSQ